MNLHSQANNYRTEHDKIASETTRSDDYLDGLGDCYELVMDTLGSFGVSIMQVNDLLIRADGSHPGIAELETTISQLQIADATVASIHDLLHEAYFEKLDRMRAFQKKADFQNQQNQ